MLVFNRDLDIRPSSRRNGISRSIEKTRKFTLFQRRDLWLVNSEDRSRLDLGQPPAMDLLPMIFETSSAFASRDGLLKPRQTKTFPLLTV